MKVVHTIKPIFDENSKVLILGTIPSPKSREAGFYYGHKQNKFWRIISDIFGIRELEKIEDKKKILINKGIALWDVLQSCEIENADDSSIKDVIVNDFSIIFKKARIKKVFTTGKKAFMLYNKHCSEYGYEAFYLPSTSPSNCRFYKYEELLEKYKVILDYI